MKDHRWSPRIGPVTALLGAGGGVLLALAFPPADLKLLAWVGMVPLLLAIRRSRTAAAAALVGLIAGFAFFLIVLHPSLSSHDWTGWATVSRQELAAMRDRQWWFLNVMWLLISATGGIPWAGFAASLKLLWGDKPWRLVTIAPALWIVQEWVRVHVFWGFHWGALGNAMADFAALRQLAALGGVWLVSAAFVIGNCGLFVLFFGPRNRRERLAPVAACGVILAAAFVGGVLRLHNFAEGQATLRAGALQHHLASYRFQDFTVTGLSRQYVDLMEQIFSGMGDRLDLLVLPESVSFGSVSLDGTLNPAMDANVQVDVHQWETLVGSLIGSHRTVVVIGSETSSQGQPHNSLLFFTRDGLVGVYHKQNLVPFAERVPPVAAALGVGGETSLAPGTGSSVVHVNGMALGGFICQEVLYPETIRRAVRSGATILVSGGNDGVFANPAVAVAHADIAQIRAVESGRYIVRAMKTGISAIIDPTGRERQRSGTEPVFLWAAVGPRSSLTPYARFGDSPILLVSLLLVSMVASARIREARKTHRP